MQLYAHFVKPKKSPKFTPAPQNTENHIRMEDYYQIKEPDVWILQDINPEVIRNPGEYTKQISAVIDLWAQQNQPMAIYKNKIVPFSEVVDGKIVARSGSQVLSKDLGLPIHEFEYSTKSLDNVICAM